MKLICRREGVATGRRIAGDGCFSKRPCILSSVRSLYQCSFSLLPVILSSSRSPCLSFGFCQLSPFVCFSDCISCVSLSVFCCLFFRIPSTSSLLLIILFISRSISFFASRSLYLLLVFNYHISIPVLCSSCLCMTFFYDRFSLFLVESCSLCQSLVLSICLAFIYSPLHRLSFSSRIFASLISSLAFFLYLDIFHSISHAMDRIGIWVCGPTLPHNIIIL